MVWNVRVKKWLKTSLLVLFGLSLVTLLWLVYASKSIPPKLRDPSPVVGLAPNVKGPLLAVKHFIADTPRPDDPTTYPIPLGGLGPVMPLYSGGLSYPFYCGHHDQGLASPVVDNQQGYGVEVKDAFGKVLGYSKDCSAQSQVFYYQLHADGAVQELAKADSQRALQHLAPLSVADDSLLVRVELGTINRYFYYLVMPVDAADVNSRNQTKRWNQQLIYQFNGGVGVGFRQGALPIARLLKARQKQLQQGFAVISSSVNRTSHTYNFLLAEDTARRVKRQFSSLYGAPQFTIGIGGSGGGIAQYLLAQNAPGLLDGLIPQYSYPDMVSQTLYALDCDLFNDYYAFRAAQPAFWQAAEHRQWLEGLSASPSLARKMAWQTPWLQVAKGRWPAELDGATQCSNAWFGLSSLIHNPNQGRLDRFVSDDIYPQVHWSYWEDLVPIFGRDERGFARHVWNNEGVQYGLAALSNGQISLAQFIDVNAKIGAWKAASEMRKERIRYLPGIGLPLWLTQYSFHNITQPEAPFQVAGVGGAVNPAQIAVAPRHSADLTAINRAYRYGQIFIGRLTVPTIDLRHYLEPKLDMHHMQPSFATRARIANYVAEHSAQGQQPSAPDKQPLDPDKQRSAQERQPLAVANEPFATSERSIANNAAADNHPAVDSHYQQIWVAAEGYDPTELALATMVQWLTSGKQPTQASDRCFDEHGQVLAAGAQVWQQGGDCLTRFPVLTTSRGVAGAPLSGDVFACQRISVDDAIARGFYGNVDVATVVAELKQIFPSGVCDYSKKDAGRPSDL